VHTTTGTEALAVGALAVAVSCVENTKLVVNGTPSNETPFVRRTSPQRVTLG
jgi:hypothetical protein